MPILQVLLISILGAFMATEYLNLLPVDARKSLNKVMHAMHTYISLEREIVHFLNLTMYHLKSTRGT